MKNFYANSYMVGYLFGMNTPKKILKKLLCLSGLFFSINIFSQSNHTVNFTNSSTDFNALEKISASAGGTDYYITFDQNNLYIGAFNLSGFAATDNLAVYVDTDPQFVANTGNGSITGKTYNGVTPSLPFKADYNVYAEQLTQEANNYSGGWVLSSGPTYSTTSNSREVKIPFSSMGNPYALNITMWMGSAGSIYFNAPGANIASSATPVIINYFGTFGIKNGAQGNVNPVNVITSPATGYLASSGTVSGGTYAFIDVTGTTTITSLTLAPGGVINVNAGQTLTSSGTINNTAVTNNTKSTQINVSGTYSLTGRAYCSYFNVNNGGTYNHNSAGSVPNGVAADWPGIDTRTYGATSNVNILQWATTGDALPIGIPAPTSAGWGNVTINVSQTYGGNWNQKGAFNNVAGNLTLNKLGTNLTPTPAKNFTFNPQLSGATINIGGNFQFSAGANNNVFLCEPTNPGPSGAATHTMNVHGDFLVKSGHLKFAYHYATAVINSYGSYIQTGGDVQAVSNAGLVKVIINSYGINKILSATGFSSSFSTIDVVWYIQNGAVIGLSSDLLFLGKSLFDPTNIELIVNGTLNCNARTIYNLAGAATFTLSPGGTLGIGSSSGIAAAGPSGNIQMTNRNFSTQANYVYNGTSNQVTGSGLPATVNSLTINNSSNSNTVSLTNNVIITSYHEIDKGIFSLGAKNVTLHSDVNATASFNRLGAGANITYGTGRYIVERFINTGTGAGQHGKSWQLLSTPANGGTVFNTWQESGISTVGYGTWITDPAGTAKGFDAYSPMPSIKTYNPISNGWDGISSTSDPIANPNGYFLFVRGDRLSTEITSPVTSTTLRITGKLFTGNQVPIIVTAGLYQCIGNPYPSVVNFQTLFSKSSNIDNSFYVWDPSLSGSYGVGGYQTISGVTGYMATPGGSNIYKSSIDYRNIQSGEAVLVHNSSAANGNVIFTEDCKETGSYLVNRVGTTSLKQLLFCNLYTSSGALADGNAVAFDESYSDKIDKDDALKISNAGENFGIRENGELLAVEARSLIKASDTVFYDIHNLKQQGYRLLFVPKNMPLNLNAFLIDRYLKTEKRISFYDSTFIDFSVTSDMASSAANRFIVVFRPFTSVLSVPFLSLKASRQETNILLTWNVQDEKNINEYVVERSTDGINFSMIATVGALPAISKTVYYFEDKNPIIGNNYYRIRSMDVEGKVMISPVVKVFMGNLKPSINVYPNPLQRGNISLQFIEQHAGNYSARLINAAGQLLLSKELNYPGGNGSQIIPINKNMSPGIYQLEIISPDGEKYIIKVVE